MQIAFLSVILVATGAAFAAPTSTAGPLADYPYHEMKPIIHNNHLPIYQDTKLYPYIVPTRRIFSSSTTTTTSTTTAVAETHSAFAAIAARSGSPFHLNTINARDTRFWLGIETSSDCETSKDLCARGNETTFDGGNDSLTMSVQVPGGQKVYVAHGGALGFLQPHATYKPQGSVATGFVKKSRGRLFGGLSYDGGFWACPVEGSVGSMWQVYVNANGFNKAGCLDFDVLTVNTTGVGAWEYV